MSEENENAVEETVEEPIVQEQVEEVAKEPEKEDEQVVNWKKANEVLKFQKMQIEELQKENSQLRQQPQPVVEEKDEFDDLPQNDYLTVQQARKMAEKMAEKQARKAVQQEIAEYDRNQRLALDEQRCQSKYEDYNYVMENFALPMIKNDPALLHKIQHSKNPAETAYKLGKLSDSYEETMAKSSSPSPKAEKILKNTQRPVSSNASGTLKQQADHYSKMTKEQIWAESQKYARQA
jgi:hypothetical protein